MKYSEAKSGRVFVLRLEDGDILHEEIERLALSKEIKTASIIVLGGADKGSKLVVGPRDGRGDPILAMDIILDDVHEITGTGTIFPDKDGRPVLHMHIACGRGEETRTGCVRRGVKVWHVMEVIIHELIDSSARRLADPVTGFELLTP